MRSIKKYQIKLNKLYKTTVIIPVLLFLIVFFALGLIYSINEVAYYLSTQLTFILIFKISFVFIYLISIITIIFNCLFKKENEETKIIDITFAAIIIAIIFYTIISIIFLYFVQPFRFIYFLLSIQLLISIFAITNIKNKTK